MEITMCIECNANERKSLETFLCESCLNDYLSKLRKKYGGYKPSEQELEYQKWKSIARKNGISYMTFRSRINEQDMTLEEAATVPLRQKRSRSEIKDCVQAT